MADTAEGTASTVMPLPLSVQPAGWVDVQATRVTFAGITHFVIDCAQPDETLVQRAIAAAPEASAVGAIFLDRAHGSIKPVVFVRETASCVAENSCASGSVATAVVLTRTLPSASRRSALVSRAARLRSACSARTAR